MFFYVSFLRPPPTRASLHSPVLITPQVANDLRTEPCYVDQDIFYDWILVDNDPPRKKSVGGPPAKKAATKLMTWKNANAYKEIPVPLPHGVREGQRWRLVLSAVPSAAAVPSSARIPSNSIYLDEETIGKWNPFSVSSMPVTFTGNARSVKGAPKQEQIERTYEFRIVTEFASTGDPVQPPSRNSGQELVNQLKGFRVEDGGGSGETKEAQVVRLVIREQTSFDLDKKIWDSGIGLGAWLVQFLNNRFSEPRLPSESKSTEAVRALDRLKHALTSSGPLNIVELGAGTGIVALVLAALRSRIAEAEDRILTTDLDSAIPLLQHNIDNNESTRSSKISLKAGVLDWDEKVSEQLPSQDEVIDLVVMADVTYNTSSFPSLIRTLADLRNMDPAKRPCFLMGYKEREEAERTLWDMVEGVGIKFLQVGSVPGYLSGEEVPIEVWLG